VSKGDDKANIRTMELRVAIPMFVPSFTKHFGVFLAARIVEPEIVSSNINHLNEYHKQNLGQHNDHKL
jgi:hypothetical protein